MNFFTRIRFLLSKLIRSGLFTVLFSEVFCKIITFFGGMILVRMLSKDDYGAYTYIMNCYGMLFLLNDLGCNSATAQFCSETHDVPEKSNAFFFYGMSRGLLFSLVTSVLIFLSPWFYPFNDLTSANLCRSLCLVPLLTTVSAFIRTHLQIQFQYGKFAKINFFSTVINYLMILPLSFYLGVRGAVYSNYAIQLLVLAFSLYLVKGHFPQHQKKELLKKLERRSLLKLAFATQLNSAIQTGFFLMDILLISLFIGGNEVISSYKVATIIPSALSFIPGALLTFVIPHFARHNQDIDWVRHNYRRMIGTSFAVNLIITVCGIALGPWGIPFVFGRQYEDAVSCYTILMIGYFFSATFSTSTGIIYTQRKIKVNLFITVLACSANCVLDIILILRYGSFGAAWATTLVHIIRSGLSFSYMSMYLNKIKK